MIVMGIDASTTCTGWSIFDGKDLIDYGCIKPLGDDWRERMVAEGPEIIALIKKYNPEKIYMEDVPLEGKFSKTMVVLGAVQGFIYGIASSLNVPIVFLLPTQWRSDIKMFNGTRDGMKRDAMKEKAVKMANALFHLELDWIKPKSKKNQDDIAEAILIAYSQINKPKQIVFKH